jgi:voltage-gated potassium channel
MIRLTALQSGPEFGDDPCSSIFTAHRNHWRKDSEQMKGDKYDQDLYKYLIRDLGQVRQVLSRMLPYLPLPSIAVITVFVPLYQYPAWRVWVTLQFACAAIIFPLSIASVIRSNRVAVVRPRLAAFLGVTLTAVVGFFAAEYRVIEAINPGEFNTLETGVDALYFSVTVMATVGFGDVHAQGQLAKLAVTLQMIVDLVGVAIVLSVVAELASGGRGRDGGDGQEGDSSQEGSPDGPPWPPTFDH